MATSRTKSIKKAAGKAKAAVKKTARKVAAAVTPKKALNRGSKGAKKGSSKATGSKRASAPSRKVQRKSDVTPRELETMTPSQQSARGPFDKHRGERLRDIEALRGVNDTDDRWAEEDQATNRTGDKRIGTRGRKSY